MYSSDTVKVIKASHIRNEWLLGSSGFRVSLAVTLETGDLFRHGHGHHILQLLQQLLQLFNLIRHMTSTLSLHTVKKIFSWFVITTFFLLSNQL